MSIKLTKICLYCKKEFEKPINESLKNWVSRHKYCSRKCYEGTMMGNDPFKNCRRKSEPWNKGGKIPQLTGENNPRWSSIKCNCKICGKEFIVQNARKDIAKYCSSKCKIADNLGLTSQNMRIRRSKKYNEWRILVFERDNYTCQKCGIRNKKGIGKTIVLNADHIKSFAFYPELRFDINNGITLCEDCHRKTDTFGVKAWRAYKNLTWVGNEA